MLAPVFLYAQLPDDSKGDSTDVDSAGIADTNSSAVDSASILSHTDTIPPYPVSGAPLGSLRFAETNFAHDLKKEDLNDDLYFSLFEPLSGTLPAYPLSQGAPGLIQTFSYAGSGTLPVLYNGRPLSGYGVELYSPEFIERVEVLQGSEAALYGGANVLMALNAVQPRFDVAGSYMRLAWAQGFGTTNSDVSYARNIAPRTNLALGFRNVSSDGQYDNQEVSFWSARGSLMWRPSSNLTLSLSELFTDLTRGANGGLTGTSLFTPGLESVVNDSLDEHHLRHDLTLAFQWYPDGAEHDSLPEAEIQPKARVDGALYFSHAEHSFKVGEEPAEIPGLITQSDEDRTGVRFGAMVPFGDVRVHANGLVDVVNGDRGNFHAGGMAEIVLAQDVRVFAGAALTSQGDLTTTSIFSEGRLSVSEALHLRLTGRLFDDNAPEAVVPDGAWSNERSRFLFEADAVWRKGRGEIHAGGTVRQVISGRGSNAEYTLITGNVSATFPVIAFLSLEQQAQLTLTPTEDKRFPLLYSRSDLYGVFSVFRNNLDLRVGARLEFQSSFAGSEYDYLTGRWLYPVASDSEERQLNPLLDLYVQGRIGSAYLKIGMSNLLGNEFYTINRYPYPGRSLRLGITWALID